tara:strand:+ start:5149 stop:5289 length:141 start_codon:yes stop_codon:yes gene_type:complete
MAELLSNCCTAHHDHRFHLDESNEDDVMGVCGQCKEWAVFIEYGDE